MPENLGDSIPLPLPGCPSPMVGRE